MNLIFNTNAATLSPIALFLQADWVVKIVMIGLLLASIWTWAIIFSFWRRLGRTRRATEKFERDFYRAEDVDAFHRMHKDTDLAVARVFGAGVSEWRQSTRGRAVDRAGTRERLATAMGAAVANEVDRISNRLNVLATVGSVAPFVGLFGTVWGIMHAFTEIAQSQSTSLTTVGPGIAEALFATAIGLVAAIPAVMAYNYFTRRIRVLRSEMDTFEQDYLNIIKRHFLR
jgi:biopolymer transport protein TolQ